MGMFDTVNIRCPRCGTKYKAQSKGGPCHGNVYELHEAPLSVLSYIQEDDPDKRVPFKCEKCGILFRIHVTCFSQVIPVDVYSPAEDEEEP